MKEFLEEGLDARLVKTTSLLRQACHAILHCDDCCVELLTSKLQVLPEVTYLTVDYLTQLSEKSFPRVSLNKIRSQGVKMAKEEEEEPVGI